MIEKLKEEALRHGDRLSLIAFSRLPEVKKTFDKLGIDPLPFFNFAPEPETDWTPRSVVVAASPSRRYSVSFDADGREFKALIPACYADDEKKNSEIGNYLKDLLEKEGYHVRQGKGLPCKALAAHTGLGVYGRNNLIYIEGFGSFLNLNIFFTDLGADDEPFVPFQILDTCEGCNLCVKNCPSGALCVERFFVEAPLQILDTCEGCNLCVKNCPSGALCVERFFVEAPRCLTRVNEDEGPFPDWVDPSWHNALIGCEKCQLTCPHNRGLLEPVEEIAHFNREETDAYLRDELPPEALEPLGIAYYCKSLGRNLKALL